VRKPRYLYHESRPARRHSIGGQGLDPERGSARRGGCGDHAVYLTQERSDCTPFGDVWRIDTRHVKVSRHFGEETWWLSLELIPPERLSLVQQGC
jgi:hypothetical protein